MYLHIFFQLINEFHRKLYIQTLIYCINESYEQLEGNISSKSNTGDNLKFSFF